ncbi:unnamed protein product [Protopolystoma xenopodis]|uniref:Uncharacterized protein n=1 Tax=Protopolystoma xenopodis TaxID=117903 RepID=A0A3S5BNS2_9PLAT|nr:unnamed protein product [Protopolystoma xenopodis]
MTTEARDAVLSVRSEPFEDCLPLEDEYEHYNYNSPEGTKGGRSRTKHESADHRKPSDARSARIHIDMQDNNKEKQKEYPKNN